MSERELIITRWSDGGVTINTSHPEHRHTRAVSVRPSSVNGSVLNLSVVGWNGDKHIGAGENLTAAQAAEVIAALSRIIAASALNSAPRP